MRPQLLDEMFSRMQIRTAALDLGEATAELLLTDELAQELWPMDPAAGDELWTILEPDIDEWFYEYHRKRRREG